MPARNTLPFGTAFEEAGVFYPPIGSLTKWTTCRSIANGAVQTAKDRVIRFASVADVLGELIPTLA